VAIGSQASIHGGALASVFEANPQLDLLTFDFHDARQVAGLDTRALPRAETISQLKAYQRLLRIVPEAEHAERLHAAGFDSAHAIAALPESVFVRKAADLGVDSDAATTAHRKAVSVKAATQHLAASIRDLTASPHYRATRAFNVAPDLEAAASTIPSYQDLFGSLAYIKCDHCESIFGPAAYFLDLMRIIDGYVTGPNTGKASGDIPPEFLLETRRPDLFTLELSCENTDRLVPFLQIVNRVLEQHIAGATDNRPFQTLAVAPYPFNLPFNLPLAEIRDNLTGLRSSLADIYTMLLAGDQNALAAGALAIAREFIGLSVEQLALVTTPQTTGTGLGPYYGYDDITSAVLAELAHVDVFLARTGLTRDALLALLQQETSPEERPSVAPTFFINATGETPSYMSVTVDRSDPNNVFERIEGLTLKRLDRVNRFVRLNAVLGWTSADLDWAMKSVSATEIEPAIEPFAGIRRLQVWTGLSVPELATFWYLVKNIGTGDAPGERIDLFDRTFNDPALLRGRNPYDPLENVPFDPSRPQTWDVHGTDATNSEIRSRLDAALGLSDDDLTKIADYLVCLTKPADGKLKTNLPTLSGLARLAGVARAAGITPGEYLLLLRLMYDPKATCVDRPDKKKPLSVADAVAQYRTVQWLKTADFNAYELSFVITGDGHGYVDPGYREPDIRPLLQSLATISAGARLNAASFVFDGVDEAASAAVFAHLRDPPAGIAYVTEIGIVKSAPVGFAVVAPLLPVRETALVTDLIDAAQAEAAFALLIANKVVLASAGAHEGPICETFGPGTSLDFLFVDDPDAVEKRDQVREVLDADKAAVEHSVAVVAGAARLQNQNAENGLAQFLGAGVDMMRVLIPFAAGKADLTEYREALLTPLPADQPVPASVETLVAILARALYLIRKLDYTAIEVQAVILEPDAFGIEHIAQPSLVDVESLWTFKTLTRAFHDTTNALIAYFAMPDGTDEEKAAKLAALSRLTLWPLAQVEALVGLFWPTGTEYSTVAGVERLRVVFDVSRQTGLSVATLRTLNGLATLPPLVKGQFSDADWKTYQTAAGTTLDAVAARHDDVDRQATLNSLDESVIEQKRDALLGFALVQVNKAVPTIKKPSDLYQYLLIDVEMSSCDQISPIAQGIASLQLYLQRARMSQEPGVADLPVPDSWWDWMSGYRLWEANRKVFLYPENYIDPSLRRETTPQFDGLEESLLQNEVSKGYVADAYQAYMDDFALVANLKIASSYRAKVTDPTTQRTVDTLFIFGRTNTEPYVYYSRRCEHYTIVVDPKTTVVSTKARWTPWMKVDITINSPWVAPVYAFGKLLIFWVEMEKTVNSIINNKQQSENHTVWNAQVKYSFLNFRDQWVQPQTYARNAIVDFEPDDYVDGSIYAPLYNPANLYWRKAYVVHFPAKAFAGPLPPFDNGEQLLVLYGPSGAYPPGVALGKPDSTPFPEEDRLNHELYLGSQRIEALSKAVAIPPGRVPLKPAAVVNTNLAQQSLYVALFSYYPGLPDTPQGYTGVIASRQLSIASIGGPIYTDYYADSYLPPDATLAPGVGDPAGAPVLLVNLAPANTAIITTKNQPGWFVFDNGDDVFLSTWQISPLRTIDETIVASSAIANVPAGILPVYNRSYTIVPAPPPDQQIYAFTRLGTHTVAELSQTLFTGGIDALLTIKSQEA
jgi:hypothetical protein